MSTVAYKKADEDRFAKLRADYLAKSKTAQDLSIQLQLKYGSAQASTWASRGEKTKLERLHAARDKVADKIFQLITKLNPHRDFGSGFGYHWLAGELTWEDAVTLGPMSVVPPAAYGFSEREMQVRAGKITQRVEKERNMVMGDRGKWVVYAFGPDKGRDGLFKSRRIKGFTSNHDAQGEVNRQHKLGRTAVINWEESKSANFVLSTGRRAKSRAGAHRATRSRRHLGASVNRAGGHRIREIGRTGEPMGIEEYTWQVSERLRRKHHFDPRRADEAVKYWATKIHAGHGSGRIASLTANDIAKYERGSSNRAGAPPGPPRFGHEKTASDIHARIKWERWAAKNARRHGDPSSEIIAQAHDRTAAAYEDLLVRRKSA